MIKEIKISGNTLCTYKVKYIGKLKDGKYHVKIEIVPSLLSRYMWERMNCILDFIGEGDHWSISTHGLKPDKELLDDCDMLNFLKKVYEEMQK